MYKPGTQLIINELWARETAEKLGFELTGGYRTVEGTWFPHRIVVTSDGPNAAERFLPQLDDLADTETPNKTSILGLGVGLVGAVCKEKNSVKIYGDAANWRTCKRIIERNGIPFPQFSEVIEP